MDQIVAMVFSVAVEMPAALIACLALHRPLADFLSLRTVRAAMAHPGARVAGLAAVAAGLGTLVTHAIVWYGVLHMYPSVGYWPAVIVGEAFAVLGEWPVYIFLAGLAWRRALAVSLAANCTSFLSGLWLI